MKRRTGRVLAIGGGAAAVAAAVAATIGLGGGGGPQPEPEPGGGTVEITRGTLVDAITLDGQIGFGPVTALRTAAQGTVTWLAPVGSVVERGEVLLRVDDAPVVLIFGTVPEYRSLAEGATGNDVRQLEENLAALGYGAGLTVDESFTAVTAAKVRAWQEDLGLPATGVVELGTVHVEPGAVRVADHLVRPGAPAGGDVLSTTGTLRLVETDVDAGEAAWAVPQARVEVVLPDGRTLPGEVVSTGGGAAPEGGGPGGPVHVVIAVDDQEALAAAARGRVTVRHVVQERHNVLSVPVSALLALAEGGYGLEVVDADGSRYVAVTLGLFAEGRVEVSGPGITEGMTVRVP